MRITIELNSFEILAKYFEIPAPPHKLALWYTRNNHGRKDTTHPGI